MSLDRLRQLAGQIKAKQEMDKSLEMAQKRQRRMLPTIPKLQGIDFHAFYQPATNLSGDFYDFIHISPTQIGIALGDVSGHGIEAGIIMGMAKKALQIYAQGKTNPKDPLSLTNTDLATDLDGETFVSACYGILDTGARKFSFARAGHNPPYLINPARTPTITEIKPNGMVIGVDKTGKRFPSVLQEQIIDLQQGDLLMYYTDGVVEAPNPEREEFSEEKLKELLLRNHAHPVAAIIENVVDSVMTHIGTREQEDDITLIGFKVL